MHVQHTRTFAQKLLIFTHYCYALKNIVYFCTRHIIPDMFDQVYFVNNYDINILLCLLELINCYLKLINLYFTKHRNTWNILIKF